MASRQVTAVELKVLDPRRFDKEFYEWTTYALWDEWTEFIEEKFKEDMKPFGVQVDSISYGDIGSCGASAVFDGSVCLWTFMEQYKIDDVPLSELYPAMYLAVKADESYVRIVSGNRGRMEISIHEGTCYLKPLGVFSGLDEESWQDLIEDQWCQFDPNTTIEQFLRDKCSDLARDLNAEYEYLTSEESFLGSCECNEITFELEIEDEICA